MNFENLKKNKFYSKENIKKLIYLFNRDCVSDLLLFSICINKKKVFDIEELISYVRTCKVPKFPITGDYLKNYGYEAGKKLGKKLKSLEEKWIENNFILDRKIIEKSLDKSRKN